MSDPGAFQPYAPLAVTPEESLERGRAFFEEVDARRSVRDFSSRPVPREMIELAIRSASTAPSGAHKQPWTWAVVSSADLKKKLRAAAEEEEKAFYSGRATDDWLEALAPLGTTWSKPFLETAPWIVVLFVQRYGLQDDGSREKHYYVQESCGIAAGLFIAALHHMGLATLTHTPSPMGFLREVMERPSNEAAMILFPVGYPADDAQVPVLARKPLADVSVWFEDEE